MDKPSAVARAYRTCGFSAQSVAGTPSRVAVSGIPGGILSPSLAVGAGMGATIAQLFPTAPLGAIILLGMVSYFAGVVQAPITAFVIAFEMTENHDMVLPLMVASLIAYATSRVVCPGRHLPCARERLPAPGDKDGLIVRCRCHTRATLSGRAGFASSAIKDFAALLCHDDGRAEGLPANGRISSCYVWLRQPRGLF